MDRFRASVEALRRGEEPPEDGYQGAYVARARRPAGRPGARRCSSRSRRRSSASASTSTRGRGRASSRSALPELLLARSTRTRRTARSGRGRRAYGDDKDRVAVRSADGEPTYRAADVVYLVDKLERGFDRAIYVLGADHHGTAQLVLRRSRGCSATTRSGSRCCSTSSCT